MHLPKATIILSLRTYSLLMLIMSEVLWCLLMLCACVWWWCSAPRRTRKLLAALPSFPQLPLLGNIHQIPRNSINLFQFLEKIAVTCDTTEMPFVFWLGPRPILFISDPEDVKGVNNAFIEKPHYYSFAKVWLGNGLVVAPPEIWKNSIKKLSGTFTPSIVEGYQEVFAGRAADLVQRLKARTTEEPFDIMHDLAYTTLEAICQTAFGFPKISESIVTKEYYDAFHRCLELLIRRGLNPLLHLDFMYRLTPASKELQKCVGILHNVSNTVITKLIQERECAKQDNRNEIVPNRRRFKSFLDLMLEMQVSTPELSVEQIRSEVDTVLFGGHETVATTLFYALLMIGRDKNLQDKLYNEVRDVVGDGGRPVTGADLPHLRYCEATVLETLRLFPPFPAVLRMADKDLQLSSGKCVVPRGTVCAVSAMVMGRARRLWGPDAAEYRPERWLAPPHAQPAAFLAFSYGRRACIGKNYAMAILKTVLASCVRELEFTAEQAELQLKLDVVLRPASGHLLQVKTRNLK
ncbi:cytochrome P450 4V2-like isoform X2 [Bombyx mandarina]|uniref:Cytochrome P450 4V2-like isoform X2 n=1 Tax=Bombyx mandarina TaxID=7092 RepID=A0A6J2KKV9_BOMMA|nr:cytochrome P450 4V2-like isoform X2 [Bombyx mandarina]